MRFNGAMDTNYWRSFFRARAARPLPEVTPPSLPGATRAALAASLARFQKGESGEGRIASEVRRRSTDAAYAEAIGLFVREEGRHARVLAAAVRALGGALIDAHWSDRLFIAGRRLLGFDLEISVLLAAEVVGRSYYGVLSARLPGALGVALADIAADEGAHLDFHASYLASRPLMRSVSRLVTWLGAAIVLLDHHDCFTAIGVERGAFLREIVKGLDDVVAVAHSPSERLRSRAA